MKHEPLTPCWHSSAPPKLNAVQKYWLFRPGPLTQGLRRQGTVRIHVIGEFPALVTSDEAPTMHARSGDIMWVREICMSINNTAAVVARSLTPLNASRSVWHAMRRLRTRPLADILYHDPAIVRSVFECCIVKPSLPIHKTVGRAAQLPTGPGFALLARRSVFWKNNQPLQVTECFLPSFWTQALIHPKA